MRVLLVSHRYPPDGVGGVERYVETLAAELERAGDTVAVFTRRESSYEPGRLVRERPSHGITVLRCCGESFGVDRFLHDYQRSERLFESSLLEFEPDVVHINHVLGLSPRIIQIATEFGLPVVVSLHDFYFACPLVHLQTSEGGLCDGPRAGRACAETCFPHEGEEAYPRWVARAAYFRSLLDLADRVLCPSDYVAQYFIRYGLDKSKVAVVHNGVVPPVIGIPTGMRRALGTRQPLRLAFIGSVVPHKGVDLIIHALRLAAIDEVELLVLGNTPDPGYVRLIRDKAREVPGLRLQVGGTYAPSDLDFLLCSTDCVIVPSRVPESFSLTLREALIRGIPAVVAMVGALPEGVIDGKNGYTFAPGSAAELAAILVRVAEDRQIVSRLSDGAANTRVVTVAEHTQVIRGEYEKATEARRTKPDGAVANEWLDAQFSSLIRLGFASGRPQ